MSHRIAALSTFRIDLRTLTLAWALAIVFALTLVASPAAQAQTFSVIHSFTGNEGAAPKAGVTYRAGILYGTASSSLEEGPGTVYQLMQSGSDWLASLIFFFGGGLANPGARVVFGPDGHLYGTTYEGGPPQDGTVFNLIPPLTICKTANCFWKVTELHAFTGFPSDGATPGYGDLIWDPQGNVYGTTAIGGTKEYGVVYELMPPIPPSKNWTESVIWSFTGPDGENPQNGVIFDRNGNLFGTAKQGGLYGFGTVFKLTPSGNGWVETNAYDFQGSADGKSPIAGLMIDGSGNIYGATGDGGSAGGGTIFELTPSGNSYTFKLLYSFSGQQGNSCGPWGTLTIDAAGNLYGTTYCGGASQFGSVFELTNTQNGWVYTSLHDFTGSNDGGHPISNVTIDANGNLYGTAVQGGEGYGVVWMITR